jgi:AraC-like DNA-binding protein
MAANSEIKMLTTGSQIKMRLSKRKEFSGQLQISLQHVGETIHLLIDQAIPLDLQYLQSRHSELPIVNEGAPISLPAAETTSKSASLINAGKTPMERCISDMYDKYIANGLASTPPTQEEIAAELNISTTTFKSRFRALYGKSFYQVYMDKKMEYAAQLLRRGYRANKVSAMVGYGEKSCIKFNKMFQKHFGMTPKRYQMTHLKK